MPRLISSARWGSAAFVFAAGALLAGCASSDSAGQGGSITQRQDRALQDPFGYTPDAKKSDMSVSGHGEFDKEGFERDKDFVLNP